MPKVAVVSQDIGRVLLNFFTNAFYATQQKVAQATLASYKPIVTVATRVTDNFVEISV